MRQLQFGGMVLDAPEPWDGFTDYEAQSSKPFTLARHHDGAGALQFSIALYRSGPAPDPSCADLLDMARGLGRTRGLGEPFDEVMHNGAMRSAAASFRYWDDADEAFLRVWYLSDGRNIALVTYICGWEDREQELPEAERMVASLRFTEIPPAGLRKAS